MLRLVVGSKWVFGLLLLLSVGCDRLGLLKNHESGTGPGVLSDVLPDIVTKDLASGTSTTLVSSQGSVVVPANAFGTQLATFTIQPPRELPPVPNGVLVLGQGALIHATDTKDPSKTIAQSQLPMTVTMPLDLAAAGVGDDPASLAALKKVLYVLIKTADGRTIDIPPSMLTVTTGTPTGAVVTFDTVFSDATYLLVKSVAGAPEGYTDYKAAVDAATKAKDILAPVITVAAVTATSLSGTGLTLKWQKATDDLSAAESLKYFIYRASLGDVSGTNDAAAHATLLNPGGTQDIDTFDVVGLTSSTSYYFTVAVEDAAGNAAAYTALQVKTLDAVPPAVPVGLTASSSVGQTSLTLTWTKASDDQTQASELTYFIYRSTSDNIATAAAAAANGVLVNAGGTPDIGSYNVTNLNAGTSYYFTVVVQDGAGNATAYTKVHVTTVADTAAPTTTSATVTASSLADSSLTLTWTQATDDVTAPAALTYFIYRSASNNISTAGDAATNGFLINSGGSAGIGTYNVTGLTAAKTYYFTVVVKDASLNALAYTSMSATTPDTTAPTATSTTITVSNLAETGLTLNWTKATDNGTAAASLKYFVYKSASDNISTAADVVAHGGTPLNGAGGSADIGTYGVTGLTVNTPYYFNVVVKDAANNVLGYTKVSATTADVTVPTVSTPTLTPSGLSETGVTLTWTKATDNVTAQSSLTYFVYKSTSNDIDTAANALAHGTLLNTGGSTDIGTYGVTGLAAGTSYYLNVVVQDAAGKQNAYTSVHVTTQDLTAPTSTSLAITSSNLTDTSLSLSWTKASDNGTAAANLRYYVYKSSSNNIDTPTNAAANGVLLNTGGSLDIGALAVSGLAAGMSYYFNVVVTDAAGNAAAYTSLSATTTDTVAPTLSSSVITVSSETDVSVVLSWVKATDNGPASNLRYAVYRSDSNNIADAAAAVAHGTLLNGPSGFSDISSFVAGGLTPGATYYFNVLVTDSGGNTAAYAAVSGVTSAAKSWVGAATWRSVNAAYINIAVADQDSMTAIWRESVNFEGHAYANSYSAGSWGTALQLDTTASDSTGNQVLAIRSNGDTVVAWEQHVAAGDSIHVAVSSGGSWGSDQEVVAADGWTIPAGPKIATNDHGDILLAWYENPPGGLCPFQGNCHLWAKVFTGGTWGADVQIDDVALNKISTAFSLSINSHGDAVIAWSQDDLSNKTDLYAKFFNFSGGAWGSKQKVSSLSTGFHVSGSVAVAFNDNGDAAFLWSEYDNGSSYHESARTYAGGSWSSITSLSPYANEPSQGRIAMDSAGDVVALWVQSDGSLARPLAKRLQGGVWSSLTTLTADAHDLQSGDPVALAMDLSTGTAMAIWTQNYGGNDFRVFASRFDGASWRAAEFVSAPSGAPSINKLPSASMGSDGSVGLLWHNANSLVIRSNFFR